MKSNNINNKAFSETINIIEHMDEKLKLRIPNKFIEMLNNNKDDNYIVNIDYSKSINEQKLLRETRIILSLIYRDYICSIEERKQIIENDNIELKRIEEELKEKYNIDNIFKKRQETKPKEILIVEYKENFFTKILNIIKTLFNIN